MVQCRPGQPLVPKSLTQPRPSPSPGSPVQLFPKPKSSCSHCQMCTAPPASLTVIPELSHPDVPPIAPLRLFPLPSQGSPIQMCPHHPPPSVPTGTPGPPIQLLPPDQLFSLSPGAPPSRCAPRSPVSPNPALPPPSPAHGPFPPSLPRTPACPHAPPAPPPPTSHRAGAIFNLPFSSLLLCFHPEPVTFAISFFQPGDFLFSSFPPSGDEMMLGGGTGRCSSPRVPAEGLCHTHLVLWKSCRPPSPLPSFSPFSPRG